MTTNYKIVRRKKQYCVLEIYTNLIISRHNKRNNATTACYHLNSGGGFDGLTPLFIISDNSSISPININEAFTDTFK